MTAQEAKALSNKALDVKLDLKIVHNYIGAATMSGNFNTQVNLDAAIPNVNQLSWQAKNTIANKLLDLLKAEGYAVSRNHGSDQREGDWDYIIIDWT